MHIPHWAAVSKKKKKSEKNPSLVMQFLCLSHLFYFANGSRQHGINKIINADSFINSQNPMPLCLLSCSSGNKKKNCKGEVESACFAKKQLCHIFKTVMRQLQWGSTIGEIDLLVLHSNKCKIWQSNYFIAQTYSHSAPANSLSPW